MQVSELSISQRVLAVVTSVGVHQFLHADVHTITYTLVIVRLWVTTDCRTRPIPGLAGCSADVDIATSMVARQTTAVPYNSTYVVQEKTVKKRTFDPNTT